MIETNPMPSRLYHCRYVYLTTFYSKKKSELVFNDFEQPKKKERNV